MKGAAPGPRGWVRMSGNVGSVTRDRYDELVKLGHYDQRGVLHGRCLFDTSGYERPEASAVGGVGRGEERPALGEAGRRGSQGGGEDFARPPLGPAACWSSAGSCADGGPPRKTPCQQILP